MSVLIIAEAGVNHNGSMDIARQLIDVAAEAGADIIKFQTFKTENLVSKSAPKANYQKKNLENGNDFQYEMLKKLELSQQDHLQLIDYCKKKNIKFLSTAFDLESIDFLKSINLSLWKIPSGEITNYPYLKKIASYSQPVILSTGMSEMEDISNALDVLLNNGLSKDQITLLHCTTEYPAPLADVNLLAMKSLRKEFGVSVGYSDHTEGIEVSIAAVALGAEVIEKHLTLDKCMEGPDHRASIEPSELRQLIKSVRNVEKALGSAEKKLSDSERKNRLVARKSILASSAINQGDLFTEQNITVKRPGGGISPMRWEEVIGKRAVKNFSPDDFIEL